MVSPSFYPFRLEGKIHNVPIACVSGLVWLEDSGEGFARKSKGPQVVNVFRQRVTCAVLCALDIASIYFTEQAPRGITQTHKANETRC
jgi:hypothetical protein